MANNKIRKNLFIEVYKWASTKAKFTYDELRTGMNLTDEEWRIINCQHVRVNKLFIDFGNSDYALSAESQIALLEHEELQLARQESTRARKDALKSQKTATKAIWISIASFIASTIIGLVNLIITYKTSIN
jgi:hypothetical protein